MCHRNQSEKPASPQSIAELNIFNDMHIFTFVGTEGFYRANEDALTEQQFAAVQNANDKTHYALIALIDAFVAIEVSKALGNKHPQYP